MTGINKAACIGGGVIGGGWIARFLLAGIDVNVFDPHPEASRIVGEVLANAENAYAMLTGAPLPPRGRLTFCATLEEAVAGADWIQESVPERLDLKRGVLTAIDAVARPDALIGSSTSGLLPTDLQRDMTHPERLFVAHPYNPVYLLPLVEIVGGEKTSAATIQAAIERLLPLGMKGVHIAKEIEAFVGDRLLEALWREALWLIHDDICTVETLDDVIRYSFGLRWAQMGLFQTYRIAGGEAGMRHFLAQFGPCLAWPWTKLTDVVDLDDALIEKIGRQSDEQAAGLSIRELERIRDENLVGILQALKSGDGGKGWGAGKLLKDFEQSLWAQGGTATTSFDPSKPLRLVETKVGPAWVDYNGHMTEHRYLQVFGDTSDALLRLIGVDLAYVETGRSYYTVETHIRHLGEAKLGQTIHSTCQILGVDEKRLHVFHTLYDTGTGEALATAEHMLLHVDSKAGKATPAPAVILDKVKVIAEAHANLVAPEGVGRHVGQKR
ncbi:carnitine 3-dehydrogenase [Rhizobium leguminosarum]|uniref:L-carnitine dehydrogenase n=1 Tax=Rhizobium leguminosarum TaxID=384 RepID=A0AAJ1EI75_RHILE|nr:carnitine 3-dehydrogenase [Rhizobium leguminosarum]MBY3177249.1 carnitine 3-dehydrogenase [Rhizobium leguminosarum]MBY5535756.1 carnitine 3-dehydrogenase [Rhizobium leguminosarum]MBY5556172.1 carnitine 3-dehydrogenase [Rhizobium leguminosarum]MBY5588471.1 carnitine 3-dehydrogenase [Rhizobium leguminosarum]MBY5596949.1 carnitine 3-dehydrogenase [Rhizobium leguminosarum]